MKKQKLNFIEWNNKILIGSFKKIDLNIALIVVLDVLFYLLSGYLVVFWLQRVQAKMATFNIPTDFISMAPEQAQQFVSEIRSFYYLIIISFILLIAAIIFIASILKGIVWAKTTNTKISLKLISKFFGLNLVWIGFWFIVIFLIAYLFVPASAQIFMIAAIILASYFTNTLYTLFMKRQTFKSIFEAIKLNATKLHLFLLPYSIIYLLFYILIKLSNLLKFKYSAILLGSALVVYAAIVRYYASNLVIEMGKL